MTTPRNRLINLNATAYYHCTARCVRRAYLMGKDCFSGKSYEHRRKWVEDLLAKLATVFAIDVLAYSIMENHYHLVLHVNKKMPIQWSFKEIFERWTQLHKVDPLVCRYLDGELLNEDEMFELAAIAAEYRRRLMSISWLMRELNETIARKANKEDNCKGRFWESRYTSQALVDEAAVLSCMAYVDLNPIRASMSKTPEESNYTSIQSRIHKLLDKGDTKVKLLPFSLQSGSDSKDPMKLMTVEQYIALVDWSGRIFRKGKSGAIPSELAPILTRLGLAEKEWLIRSKYFTRRFHCVAGFWDAIVEAAKHFQRKWFHGKPSENLQI